MDIEKVTLERSEHKVVRRGLLGGLFALSAGVAAKLATPGRVQAQGEALIVGNTGAGGSQTATAMTQLTVANGGDAGLFVDISAPAPTNAIRVFNFGAGKVGVYGLITGPGIGIVGEAGFGPLGLAVGTGVEGRAVAGGTGGVRGIGGGNGVGVGGITNSGASDWSNTGNGSGVGVHGKSGSGTGVVGESQSLYGVYGQAYTGGVGVEGIANASGSIGVQGQSGSGIGVQGQSGANCGVRGLSNSFVGLVGISDTSIGLYGYNVSPNVPAFYAENLGPNNRIAGLFNGDVRVMGNFTVSGGAKNAAVTMPDGSEAVLYCQESPEPYFEDFGEAKLVNGVARVQLEREFAGLIRPGFQVFLTPSGDTRGLYVSRKEPGGFEVREAQSGTGNVAFDYRVVGKRKDIEGKRLARLDPQIKANIAQMRAAAAAKNHPSVKVPPGGNPLVPLEPIPPTPESPAPHLER